MACTKHNTRADTPTAAQKLFNSPELSAQIFSYLEKGALARLAKVSTLWHIESARHLWSACTGLQNLEDFVRPESQAGIAQLIRELKIDCTRKVWSGDHTDMPRFTNLRSVSISTKMTSRTAASWVLGVVNQSHRKLRTVTPPQAPNGKKHLRSLEIHKAITPNLT
jgi:hypothetical protein